MPQFFIAIIVFIILAIFNSGVFAQDAQQKTQQLIAALAKTKYKKKEKKNLTLETYVDIKSEAVVKNDIREYAGVYESLEANCRLELRVSTDGRVEGNGYDSVLSGSERQNFTLKDARIEGALLTATKVFASGKTQNFEAVFNNQTRVEGKNPSEINSRETKYGLGFIYSYHAPGIDYVTRVFLELKP